MTPFMLAVRSVLAGEPAPVARTEPAREQSVATAVAAQTAIRSRAEQLAAEANAVLAGQGHLAVPLAIELVDDPAPGVLAFEVGCAGHTARVQTVLSGGNAVCRLVRPQDPPGAALRLSDDEEMAAVLLALVAAAGGRSGTNVTLRARGATGAGPATGSH